MTPVHVLISPDPADEHRYLAAFGGAIELYRFASNLEAFERLTTAQAPIDVIVVTNRQASDPFTMSVDQMVARLTGSLAVSNNLARTQIIVIGDSRYAAQPRVTSVVDLDGAVRFVKFGRVESAPRRDRGEVRGARTRASRSRGVGSTDGVAASSTRSGGGIADSLIASMWSDQTSPARSDRRAGDRRLPGRRHDVAVAPVMGGGAAQHDTKPSLFANDARVNQSQGVVQPQAQQSDPHQPAMSGSATAVPAQGTSGLPPHLVQQVHQMVYRGTVAGDPILGWSTGVRRELEQSMAAQLAGMHPQLVAEQHAAQPHVRTAPMAVAQHPVQVQAHTPITAAVPATADAPMQWNGYAAPAVHTAHPAPASLANHPAHPAPASLANHPAAPAGNRPAAPGSHAAFQPYSPAPAAQAPPPGSAFEASSNLLNRVTHDGDVSFG